MELKHPLHWALLGFMIAAAAVLGRSALRGWFNMQV